MKRRWVQFHIFIHACVNTCCLPVSHLLLMHPVIGLSLHQDSGRPPAARAETATQSVRSSIHYYYGAVWIKESSFTAYEDETKLYIFLPVTHTYIQKLTNMLFFICVFRHTHIYTHSDTHTHNVMACGYISIFDVDPGDIDLWLLSPQSLLDSKTLLSAAQICCMCVVQLAGTLYVSSWYHIRMINAQTILSCT